MARAAKALGKRKVGPKAAVRDKAAVSPPPIGQAGGPKRVPKRARSAVPADNPTAPANRRARNRPKRFDDPDFDFSGASSKPDGDRAALYDTAIPAPSQHSSGSVYGSEHSETMSDSASNVDSGRVGATHSRGRKSTGSGSRRRGTDGAPRSAVISLDTVRRAAGGHVSPPLAPRAPITQPSAASAHRPAAQLLEALSPAAPALAAEPSAASSATASPVPSLPPIALSSSVAAAAEDAAARWDSHLQQPEQEGHGDPLMLHLFQQGLSGSGATKATWLESLGKDAAFEPQMPAMDGALRGAASRAHHQQRPPSPQQPRPPSRALLQAGRMYWYRGAWHALPPPPTTALQPDVQPPVFLPVSNVAAASEASVRGAAPLAQAPDVSAGFGSAPPSTAAGPGLHGDTTTAGVLPQAQWPPQPQQQQQQQQQQQPSCQLACTDLFLDDLDLDALMCESPRSVLPLAAPLAEDDMLGSSGGVLRQHTVLPTDVEDSLFDGDAPSMTSPVDWLPDSR